RVLYEARPENSYQRPCVVACGISVRRPTRIFTSLYPPFRALTASQSARAPGVVDRHLARLTADSVRGPVLCADRLVRDNLKRQPALRRDCLSLLDDAARIHRLDRDLTARREASPRRDEAVPPVRHEFELDHADTASRNN